MGSFAQKWRGTGSTPLCAHTRPPGAPVRCRIVDGEGGLRGSFTIAVSSVTTKTFKEVEAEGRVRCTPVFGHLIPGGPPARAALRGRGGKSGSQGPPSRRALGSRHKARGLVGPGALSSSPDASAPLAPLGLRPCTAAKAGGMPGTPHGRLPRGADPGPSFSPAPSSLRPVREHLGLRGAHSHTHAGGGGKPQSPPPHAAAPVHCAGSQRPRGAWPAHAWQHSRTEQSLFQKPRAHPTAGGWGSQGTAGLSPRVRGAAGRASLLARTAHQPSADWSPFAPSVTEALIPSA